MKAGARGITLLWVATRLAIVIVGVVFWVGTVNVGLAVSSTSRAG